jgi:phosphatidylserine synthase
MNNAAFLKSVWRWNLLSFLLLGTVGMAMRGAAYNYFGLSPGLIALARTDVAVYVEHLFAGIGVPAGMLGMIVFIMWTGERNTHKPPSQRQLINALFIFGLLFSSVGYLMHMMSHEMEQAFVSVYGGPPYGAIQQGQVFVGLTGILLFTVLNWSHWRTFDRGRK